MAELERGLNSCSRSKSMALSMPPLTAAAVRLTRVVGAPVVHPLVHHLLQAVHVQAVQRGGAQRVRLGAERVRRVVVARAVPVAVAVVVVVVV